MMKESINYEVNNIIELASKCGIVATVVGDPNFLYFPILFQQHPFPVAHLEILMISCQYVYPILFCPDYTEKLKNLRMSLEKDC